MAFIIFKDRNKEWRQVDDEKAKNLLNWWITANPADKIVIEGYGGTTAGEIKDIKLGKGQEDKNTIEEKLKEWRAARKGKLAMSPQERAENTTAGHFSLFYFGIYGVSPSQELIDTAQGQVEEFYCANPQWTIPRLQTYAKSIKLKGEQIQESILKILERRESRELQDIEFETNVKNKHAEEEQERINSLAWQR